MHTCIATHWVSFSFQSSGRGSQSSRPPASVRRHMCSFEKSLQWMCKRSCMTKSGFTPCFLFLIGLSCLMMGQMWCMPLNMGNLLMSPCFTQYFKHCPDVMKRTLNIFFCSFYFLFLNAYNFENMSSFFCTNFIFFFHLANIFLFFIVLHRDDTILCALHGETPLLCTALANLCLLANCGCRPSWGNTENACLVGFAENREITRKHT